MCLKSLIQKVIASLNAHNINGNTVIMKTAKNLWCRRVKMLIELGSRCSICKTRSVVTALMSTAKNGYVKFAKLLTNAGADVNIQDNCGNTALMLTAKNGYLGNGLNC